MPSPADLRSLGKPRAVVVGYLRGPAGDAALAAAATAAELRGVPLVIVHKLVGAEAPEVFGAGDTDVRRERAVESELLTLAASTSPTLENIEVRMVTTPIGEELIVASKTASLVVLGVTTRHPSTAALFDTVPRELVHHARCPVMVVPAGSPAACRPARIVCGIDRSTASIDALHWAAREADLRGVTVLAVEVTHGLREAPASSATEIALSRWVQMHLPAASTTVVCSTEPGAPGSRLVELTAANDAVLVIGSHLPGRRLGRSVARVTTAQTSVPVVVVPHPTQPR